MKTFRICQYIRSGLILFLAAVSLSATLHAQLVVTTAALQGTVTDPTGAIIPQSTVTLASAENGISKTYVTSSAGRYIFSQLPASTYQLTIRATGFKDYIQKGISLDPGQSAEIDVRLTIGGVEEQVIITSEAPLINTADANISNNIDGKEIVELPLNLRNVFGLVTLNSSVNNSSQAQMTLGGGGNTSDNADQDISFLNFAGGFFGSTAFMVDGVWDTDISWGGVIYVPSPDAVQEMRIQNNTFTAQYGWSTGNVVNVVTKSGSGKFHGDAFMFYRNAAMDANLWFNDHNAIPKPPIHRYQMGASAGGPLNIPGIYKQKDKTFIFGLYEHFDASTPAVTVVTVPTADFRTGQFAALLGPSIGTDALGRPILSGQIYNPFSARTITKGVTDPSTGLVATQTGYIRDPIANNDVTTLGPLDTIATKLMSYYPTATDPTALANNFVATGSDPAAANEYLVRIDQNIGNSTRLYGRFDYKQEYKTSTPAFFGSGDPAGPGYVAGNNRWNIALGLSHTFNQNFMVNAVVGAELWHERGTTQSHGFKPSSLGLPSYLDSSPDFPLISVENEAPLGQNGGSSLYNHGPIGSLSLDFMKTAGKHILSFGWMGVELQNDETADFPTSINFGGVFTQGPDPESPTGNTGFGMAQALLGLPDGGAAGTPISPAIAEHYLGWYVQDDWHVLRNLTLNLGFRYEIQTAPTYRHNRASSFNPDVVNPVSTAVGEILPGALQFLSSSQRGVYDTNYKNASPRVGFNYQIAPNWVLRGGYGIFYPPSIIALTGSTDGFTATTSIVSSLNSNINPTPGLTLSNLWPNGFVGITGNSLGELQDVGASSYVQQEMLGLQYSFSKSDSLEVAYVGNHGTHMLSSGISRSQLNPKYLPLGPGVLDSQVTNPFFGIIASGSSGCGLDQPTVPYSQLLQPYSQYCGVGESMPPVGFSLYNALQANYNHRFQDGLSVMVSYTYSKFIDNVEGAQSWSYTSFNGPANNYDLAAEKSVDANDIPHSLVASYSYKLPIGKGRAVGSQMSRTADAFAGGWEVSGISTFKSGIPLSVIGNDYNSYGGNPRPDVTGDPHIGKRSLNEWFNTAAFSYAAYETFGTAPRYISNLRAPRYTNFDLAIYKNWKLPREMQMQFRAEMYNAFNHPNFYAPNTSYPGCDPNAVVNCPSGFGQITSAFPSREVQMAGKFYW